MKGHSRISERDTSILLFLWRWKLGTTAVLAAKYFPNKSYHACYKRLLKLRHLGIVQHMPITKWGHGGHVWTLTHKGFLLCREHLPGLKQKVYKSEHINHDFLVTAFHLGDWIERRPEECLQFTEQELRCY